MRVADDDGATATDSVSITVTEPVVDWVHTWGTSSWIEQGRDVAIDSNDNIYVAGIATVGETSAPRDAFIQKYDSAGNLLWTRVLSGTAFEGLSYTWALALDESRNAIYCLIAGRHMVGYVPSPWDPDVYITAETVIAKFDLDGNLQPGWPRALMSAFEYVSYGWELRSHLFHRPRTIAVDNLGFVYVGTWCEWGGHHLVSGDFGFITKLSSTGSVLWTQKLEFTDQQLYIPQDIAIDDDHSIYISGYGFAAKLSSFGTMQWAKLISIYGHGGVLVDGTGIYLAGYSNASGLGVSDWCLVKLDKTGSEIYKQRYGGSYHERTSGKAIAFDSTGNICFSGWTWSYGAGGGDIGAFLIGHNTGAVMSALKTFGDSSSQYVRSMCLDSNDNILSVGSSYNAIDWISASEVIVGNYFPELGIGSIGVSSELVQHSCTILAEHVQIIEDPSYTWDTGAGYHDLYVAKMSLESSQ